MIQRIQTLYLFIVAGLFFALLFLPLAVIQSGEALYAFKVSGLRTIALPVTLVYPTWSLIVIAAIIVFLSLFIIFKYRKRVIQMRLCVYNALLMIGFCVLAGFFLWQFNHTQELPDMKINFRLWAGFPFIALILNYLAIRGIGVDEAMIRSSERLR